MIHFNIAAFTLLVLTGVGNGLFRGSEHPMHQTNIWDGALASLADPYIAMYVYLPWSIAAAILQGPYANEPFVRLRCRTRAGWARFTLRTAIGTVIVPVLIASLFGAIVAASTHEPSWTWSPSATATAESDGLAALVAVPPWIVAPTQLVLTGLTCLVTYFVVITTSLLGSRVVPIVTGVVWWTVFVISFRRTLPFPFDLARSLSVPEAVAGPSMSAGANLVGAVAAPAVLAVGIWVAVNVDVAKAVRSSSWFVRYVVVALTVTVLASHTQDALTPNELLVAVFFGAAPSGVDWASYLLIAVIVAGVSYPFSVSIEDEVTGGLELRLLRHRSFGRWVITKCVAWIRAVPLVLAALFLTALSIGFARFGSAADPHLPSIGQLAQQLIINASITAAACILLVFTARILVGTPTGSIIALGLIVVAGAFPLTQSIGIGSIGAGSVTEGLSTTSSTLRSLAALTIAAAALTLSAHFRQQHFLRGLGRQ